MKTYLSCSTVMIALQCLCFSSAGLADKTEFDAEFKAGLEQDSNVNIRELDRSAGASDTARLLNARFGAAYKPNDQLSFKASYSYASKAYREYDDFDQTVHTLSADANYDFNFVTIGGMVHKAEADLASDPFLSLNQRSLYAGRLFDDRVYLRTAFNWKEKTFDNSPGRDANADGMDVDLFVFFNSASSFVSLGLIVEDENARSAVFDNEALGFRARLSNKFVLFGKDNQMQLGFRSMRRDYSEFDLLIGDRRHDLRRSSEASWEIAFTPFLSAIGKLEYGNHDSNLASADYSETQSSITLVAKF